MSEIYGDAVAHGGMSHAQRLVVEAVAARVPAGGLVLDVGCSTGYLAAAFTTGGAVVTGVEPDPAAAETARGVCHEVITGSIDDPDVRARLPHGVAAIVFADVLEHLADPWATLASTPELLGDGGVVIASIPNIAHWTARRQVAAGRFPQDDHGLFDRTHLRFFTRASALELAERAGFRVVASTPATGPLPLEHRVQARLGGTNNAPDPRVARARTWLAARRPELFALQFVLTLQP